MLKFPVHIEPDGDSFLVTCPDLPEVTSDGDTLEEALANGADAIEEALAGRLEDFEDIPAPSEGEYMVAMPSLIGMKVLLFWELQKHRMTRADLMRQLGWKRPQVDRLFAPRHSTRLDQFDAAFTAMGVETDVSIRDIAA